MTGRDYLFLVSPTSFVNVKFMKVLTITQTASLTHVHLKCVKKVKSFYSNCK